MRQWVLVINSSGWDWKEMGNIFVIGLVMGEINGDSDLMGKYVKGDA